MKHTVAGFFVILLVLACGEGKAPSEKDNSQESSDWKPVKYIKGDLGDVDSSMAAMGEEIFQIKCTACHGMDSRLVGPPMAGVTKKRSANWLMNIMLHNDQMVAYDPDAKQLYEDYNKSLMLVENFQEEDARKVLEYLRYYDSTN